MQTVNIHEAKTHLSRLVEQAAAGAEIMIAKAGRPVARLVSLAPDGLEPRKLGVLSGKHEVPDDIDAVFSHDIEAMFYGAGAAHHRDSAA